MLIPPGFGLLAPIDDVMRACAPIYAKRHEDGMLALGLHIERQHCNARGNCHGATWTMLADVLMGLNVGIVSGRSGPTVTITIDFLGSAQVGQWIEGHARITKNTPKLGFADCLFTADGEPALRASGIFRRKFEPLVLSIAGSSDSAAFDALDR